MCTNFDLLILLPEKSWVGGFRNKKNSSGNSKAALEAIKVVFKLVIEIEKQTQKLVGKFDKLVEHATKLLQVIKALIEMLTKRQKKNRK